MPHTRLGCSRRTAHTREPSTARGASRSSWLSGPRLRPCSAGARPACRRGGGAFERQSRVLNPDAPLRDRPFSRRLPLGRSSAYSAKPSSRRRTAARAGVEPAGPRVRAEGGSPAPTWHRARPRHRDCVVSERYLGTGRNPRLPQQRHPGLFRRTRALLLVAGGMCSDGVQPFAASTA